VHGASAVGHRAAAGSQCPAQQPRQSGLPDAGGADDAQRCIPGGDRQVDALQDLVPGVAAPCVVGLKNGSCRHGASTPSSGRTVLRMLTRSAVRPVGAQSGTGPSRAFAQALCADSSSLGWNSPASTSRYSRESSLRLKYAPPPLTRRAASTTSLAVSVARTFTADRRGNHIAPWSARLSTSRASVLICG